MAGGGVGEAMLIGAAVGATAGGAGAAIQGGDPLKGALTGGAMGAVGGGIGGALAAPAATTAGGIGAGTTAGATTVGAGTTAAGTTAGLGGAAGTGMTTSFVPATQASLFGAGSQGVAGATQLGAGIGGASTAGGFGLTAPTTAATIGGTTGGTTGGVTGATAGNFTGMAPALSNTQLGMTAATTGLAGAMQAERDQYKMPSGTTYSGGNLNKLKYDPDKFTASEPTYAPESVYRPTYAAEGGIMKLAQGGMSTSPVERMSQNMMGGQGNMFPLSQQEHTNFATPTQMPASAEVIRSDYDTKTNPYTGVMMASGGIARFDGGGLGSLATGMPSGAGAGAQAMMDQGIAALGQAGKKRMLTKEQMDAIALQGMTKAGLQDVYGQMAEQNLSAGGHLGGYSDGGRMLKGPGDGMSDNIPASIAGKQPARLADGEFVIPADVVSHLGNGSTDAGAKQLYAMMNRVRKARTGNPKQGKQIKPAKYMAA
jgi:hypothetical protein